jgi:predicted PurR-regulated permease PerM
MGPAEGGGLSEESRTAAAGPPPAASDAASAAASDGGVPPGPDLVAAPSRQPDLPALPRHPLLVPMTGIFILALIGALIYAAQFLIPLSLAVLGNLILNGPRRWCGRLGVPSGVFAALVTLILAGGVAFAVLALSEPVYDFVADIPGLLEEVAGLMTSPSGPLAALDRAADATQAILQGEDGERPVQVEVVEEGNLASSVVAIAPALLGQVVFAICMLFFLLASGDLFIRKAVQVADRFEDKRRTVETLTLIEARLGRYLGAITLINAGLGVAVGLAMWWWGLPNPLIIGVMAFALNFVPFVGAVIGTMVAGLVGFLEFGDAWTALGVCATYYALTAFEGQFVTPSLVSQRLKLNTPVLFVTVAFFAWIWSIMGMVVAVPMLIVLKVVCDAVPTWQKVGLFLGEAAGFGTEGMRRTPAPSLPGPHVLKREWRRPKE